MAYPAIHTAEELLQLEEIPGKQVELVSGRLVVREPPGIRHSRVIMELSLAMVQHVRPRNLGEVLAAESGYKLASNPDTVRAPDIAFIARARMPEPEMVGYPDMAPDLVVEVLSPNDRAGYVTRKVGDWLIAGARLVWVIDPARRLARVYRADGSEATILEGATLDGEDVLPSFKYPLTALF